MWKSWTGALKALAVALVLLPPLAEAACPGLVARGAPRLQFASLDARNVAQAQAQAQARKGAAITFLGHASYLIESPEGVSLVTDYNGYNVPAIPPDIATMNNAHSTHYTDHPPPEIRYVLRGWTDSGQPAKHDLRHRDLRVFNISTNTRDLYQGGTRTFGNSIFVIETAELCIAHLSHLHHWLNDEQLSDLGTIDVLIVPVDGVYTMSHETAFKVMEQVRAPLMIPTHYQGRYTLEKFLERAKSIYPISMHGSSRLVVTRANLPAKPEILVLDGY
jgi:L-ascorbate metabolism protein UlaG (beta-lactamase superfamily)